MEELYSSLRSCHDVSQVIFLDILEERLDKQPQLFPHSASGWFFLSCSHVQETILQRFQSMCPCDDTWCLKQEMQSDVSAEIYSPHFSFKAGDVTHEAEQEKVRKVHLSFKLSVHLSAQDVFENSSRPKEKNFTICSSQRTKSLIRYEIQCHTKLLVCLPKRCLVLHCWQSAVGHLLTETQCACNAHLTDRWVQWTILANSL